MNHTVVVVKEPQTKTICEHMSSLPVFWWVPCCSWS